MAEAECAKYDKIAVFEAAGHPVLPRHDACAREIRLRTQEATAGAAIPDS